MDEIEKLEAIARAAALEGWTSQDIAAFSPERVLALLAVVRAAKKVSAMSEDGGDKLAADAFARWFYDWKASWAHLRAALAAFDALEQT